MDIWGSTAETQVPQTLKTLNAGIRFPCLNLGCGSGDLVSFMERNDDGKAKGIHAGLHRVRVDIENAHWLRVHTASLEPRNLRTKFHEVFRDREVDDIVLMSFSAACRLSNRDHHGLLHLGCSRHDPNVNLEFGSVRVVPPHWDHVGVTRLYEQSQVKGTHRGPEFPVCFIVLISAEVCVHLGFVGAER